ncbi:Myosin-1 [Diplonema papillatum]|nr:Myosin-1 [Diplonema papillatum]
MEEPRTEGDVEYLQRKGVSALFDGMIRDIADAQPARPGPWILRFLKARQTAPPPDTLWVQAGPLKSLEGVYTLAGAANGVPFWKSRGNRLYTNSRGAWVIAESQRKMAEDTGVVFSDAPHDGAESPVDVKIWRHQDSRRTVAAVVVTAAAPPPRSPSAPFSAPTAASSQMVSALSGTRAGSPPAAAAQPSLSRHGSSSLYTARKPPQDFNSSHGSAAGSRSPLRSSFTWSPTNALSDPNASARSVRDTSPPSRRRHSGTPQVKSPSSARSLKSAARSGNLPSSEEPDPQQHTASDEGFGRARTSAQKWKEEAASSTMKSVTLEAELDLAKSANAKLAARARRKSSEAATLQTEITRLQGRLTDQVLLQQHAAADDALENATLHSATSSPAFHPAASSVARLQGELFAAQEEVDLLTVSRKKDQTELETLRDALHGFQAEKHRLEADLDASRGRCALVQQTVGSLKSELADSLRQCEGLQAEKDREATRADRRTQHVDEECEALRRKVSATAAEAQEKLREKERELQSQKAEVEYLKQAVARNERATETMQQRMVAERDEQKEYVDVMRAKLSKATVENTSLKADLDQAVASMDAFRTRTREEIEENYRQLNQLPDLRRKLETKEAELAQSLKRLSTFEDKLADATLAADQHKAEAASEKRRSEQLAETVEELRGLAETKSRAIERLEQTLAEVQESADRRDREASAGISKLETEILDLAASIGEKDAETEQNELGAARRAAELEQAAQNLAAEVASKTRACSQLSRELDGLRESMVDRDARYRQDHAELVRLLSEKDAEVARLRRDNGALQAASSAAAPTEGTRALEAELERERLLTADLTKRLEAAERASESPEEPAPEMEELAEMVSVLEDELREVRIERDALRGAVGKFKADRTADSAAFRQREALLKASNHTLQAELDESTSDWRAASGLQDDIVELLQNASASESALSREQAAENRLLTERVLQLELLAEADSPPGPKSGLQALHNARNAATEEAPSPPGLQALQNASKTDEASDLGARVDELQEALARERGLSAEKDREIATLQQRVDEIEANSAFDRRELEEKFEQERGLSVEKDRQIATLQQQLDEIEASSPDSAFDRRELEEKLEQERSLSVEKDGQIATLQQRLGEIEERLELEGQHPQQESQTTTHQLHVEGAGLQALSRSSDAAADQAGTTTATPGLQALKNSVEAAADETSDRLDDETRRELGELRRQLERERGEAAEKDERIAGLTAAAERANEEAEGLRAKARANDERAERLKKELTDGLQRASSEIDRLMEQLQDLSVRNEELRSELEQERESRRESLFGSPEPSPRSSQLTGALDRGASSVPTGEEAARRSLLSVPASDPRALSASNFRSTSSGSSSMKSAQDEPDDPAALLSLVQQLTSRNAALQQAISDTTASAAERDEAVAKCLLLETELQQHRHETHAELVEARETIERLRAELDSQQTVLTSVQGEVTHLGDALAAKEEEMNELRKANEAHELRQGLQGPHADGASADSRGSSVGKGNPVEDEVARLKRELEAAREERQKLVKEVAELSAGTDALEGEAKRLAAEVEKVTADKEELDALLKDMELIQAEVATLTEALADSKSHTSALQNDLLTANTRIQQLEGSLHEKPDTIQLEQRLLKSEACVEVLVQEKAALLGKVADLQSELQLAGGIMTDKDAVISGMQRLLDQLRGETRELQRAVDDGNETADALSSALSDLAQANAATETLAAELAQRVADDEARETVLIEERDTLAIHVRELEEMQKQNSSAPAPGAGEAEELTALREKEAQLNRELQRAVDEGNETADTLSSALSNLAQANAATETLAAGLAQRVADDEARETVLIEERDTLASRVRELEETQRQNAGAPVPPGAGEAEELAALREKEAQLHRELQRAVDEGNETTDALSSALSNLAQANTATETLAAELAQRVADDEAREMALIEERDTLADRIRELEEIQRQHSSAPDDKDRGTPAPSAGEAEELAALREKETKLNRELTLERFARESMQTTLQAEQETADNLRLALSRLEYQLSEDGRARDRDVQRSLEAELAATQQQLAEANARAATATIPVESPTISFENAELSDQKSAEPPLVGDLLAERRILQKEVEDLSKSVRERDVENSDMKQVVGLLSTQLRKVTTENLQNDEKRQAELESLAGQFSELQARYDEETSLRSEEALERDRLATDLGELRSQYDKAERWTALEPTASDYHPRGEEENDGDHLEAGLRQVRVPSENYLRSPRMRGAGAGFDGAEHTEAGELRKQLAAATAANEALRLELDLLKEAAPAALPAAVPNELLSARAELDDLRAANAALEEIAGQLRGQVEAKTAEVLKGAEVIGQLLEGNEVTAAAQEEYGRSLGEAEVKLHAAQEELHRAEAELRERGSELVSRAADELEDRTTLEAQVRLASDRARQAEAKLPAMPQSDSVDQLEQTSSSHVLPRMSPEDFADRDHLSAALIEKNAAGLESNREGNDEETTKLRDDLRVKEEAMKELASDLAAEQKKCVDLERLAAVLHEQLADVEASCGGDAGGKTDAERDQALGGGEREELLTKIASLQQELACVEADCARATRTIHVLVEALDENLNEPGGGSDAADQPEPLHHTASEEMEWQHGFIHLEQPSEIVANEEMLARVDSTDRAVSDSADFSARRSVLLDAADSAFDRSDSADIRSDVMMQSRSNLRGAEGIERGRSDSVDHACPDSLGLAPAADDSDDKSDSANLPGSASCGDFGGEDIEIPGCRFVDIEMGAGDAYANVLPHAADMINNLLYVLDAAETDRNSLAAELASAFDQVRVLESIVAKVESEAAQLQASILEMQEAYNLDDADDALYAAIKDNLHAKLPPVRVRPSSSSLRTSSKEKDNQSDHDSAGGPSLASGDADTTQKHFQSHATLPAAVPLSHPVNIVSSITGPSSATSQDAVQRYLRRIHSAAHQDGDLASDGPWSALGVDTPPEVDESYSMEDQVSALRRRVQRRDAAIRALEEVVHRVTGAAEAAKERFSDASEETQVPTAAAEARREARDTISRLLKEAEEAAARESALARELQTARASATGAEKPAEEADDADLDAAVAYHRTDSVRAVAAETSAAKALVEAMEEGLKEYKQQFDELEVSHHELSHENARLQQALDAARAELQDSHEAIQTGMKEHKQQFDELERGHQELSTENVALQQDLDAVRAELQGSHEAMDAGLKKHKQQVDELERSYQELSKRTVALQEALDAAQSAKSGALDAADRGRGLQPTSGADEVPASAADDDGGEPVARGLPIQTDPASSDEGQTGTPEGAERGLSGISVAAPERALAGPGEVGSSVEGPQEAEAQEAVHSPFREDFLEFESPADAQPPNPSEAPIQKQVSEDQHPPAEQVVDFQSAQGPNDLQVQAKKSLCSPLTEPPVDFQSAVDGGAPSEVPAHAVAPINSPFADGFLEFESGREGDRPRGAWRQAPRDVDSPLVAFQTAQGPHEFARSVDEHPLDFQSAVEGGGPSEAATGELPAGDGAGRRQARHSVGSHLIDFQSAVATPPSLESPLTVNNEGGWSENPYAALAQANEALQADLDRSHSDNRALRHQLEELLASGKGTGLQALNNAASAPRDATAGPGLQVLNNAAQPAADAERICDELRAQLERERESCAEKDRQIASLQRTDEATAGGKPETAGGTAEPPLQQKVDAVELSAPPGNGGLEALNAVKGKADAPGLLALNNALIATADETRNHSLELDALREQLERERELSSGKDRQIADLQERVQVVELPGSDRAGLQALHNAAKTNGTPTSDLHEEWRSAEDRPLESPGMDLVSYRSAMDDNTRTALLPNSSKEEQKQQVQVFATPMADYIDTQSGAGQARSMPKLSLQANGERDREEIDRQDAMEPQDEFRTPLNPPGWDFPPPARSEHHEELLSATQGSKRDSEDGSATPGPNGKCASLSGDAESLLVERDEALAYVCELEEALLRSEATALEAVEAMYALQNRLEDCAVEDACMSMKTLANAYEAKGRATGLESEVSRLQALVADGPDSASKDAEDQTKVVLALMDEIDELRAGTEGWKKMFGDLEQSAMSAVDELLLYQSTVEAVAEQEAEYCAQLVAAARPRERQANGDDDDHERSPAMPLALAEDLDFEATQLARIDSNLDVGSRDQQQPSPAVPCQVTAEIDFDATTMSRREHAVPAKPSHQQQQRRHLEAAPSGDCQESQQDQVPSPAVPLDLADDLDDAAQLSSRDLRAADSRGTGGPDLEDRPQSPSPSMPLGIADELDFSATHLSRAPHAAEAASEAGYSTDDADPPAPVSLPAPRAGDVAEYLRLLADMQDQFVTLEAHTQTERAASAARIASLTDEVDRLTGLLAGGTPEPEALTARSLDNASLAGSAESEEEPVTEEDLRAALAKSRVKRGMLAAKLEHLSTEHCRVLEETCTQRDDLMKQVEEAFGEIDGGASAELSAAQHDLATASAECERLSEALQAEQATSARLAASVTAAQSGNPETTVAGEQLRARCDELERELAAHANCAASLETLQEELMAAHADRARLTAELDTAEANAEMLVAKCDALEATLVSQENTIRDVTDRLKAMSDEDHEPGFAVQVAELVANLTLKDEEARALRHRLRKLELKAKVKRDQQREANKATPSTGALTLELRQVRGQLDANEDEADEMRELLVDRLSPVMHFDEGVPVAPSASDDHLRHRRHTVPIRPRLTLPYLEKEKEKEKEAEPPRDTVVRVVSPHPDTDPPSFPGSVGGKELESTIQSVDRVTADVVQMQDTVAYVLALTKEEVDGLNAERDELQAEITGLQKLVEEQSAEIESLREQDTMPGMQRQETAPLDTGLEKKDSQREEELEKLRTERDWLAEVAGGLVSRLTDGVIGMQEDVMVLASAGLTPPSSVRLSHEVTRTADTPIQQQQQQHRQQPDFSAARQKGGDLHNIREEINSLFMNSQNRNPFQNTLSNSQADASCASNVPLAAASTEPANNQSTPAVFSTPQTSAAGRSPVDRAEDVDELHASVRERDRLLSEANATLDSLKADKGDLLSELELAAAEMERLRTTQSKDDLEQSSKQLATETAALRAEVARLEADNAALVDSLGEQEDRVASLLLDVRRYSDLAAEAASRASVRRASATSDGDAAEKRRELEAHVRDLQEALSRAEISSHKSTDALQRTIAGLERELSAAREQVDRLKADLVELVSPTAAPFPRTPPPSSDEEGPGRLILKLRDDVDRTAAEKARLAEEAAEALRAADAAQDRLRGDNASLAAELERIDRARADERRELSEAADQIEFFVARLAEAEAAVEGGEALQAEVRRLREENESLHARRGDTAATDQPDASEVQNNLEAEVKRLADENRRLTAAADQPDALEIRNNLEAEVNRLAAEVAASVREKEALIERLEDALLELSETKIVARDARAAAVHNQDALWVAELKAHRLGDVAKELQRDLRLERATVEKLSADRSDLSRALGTQHARGNQLEADLAAAAAGVAPDLQVLHPPPSPRELEGEIEAAKTKDDDPHAQGGAAAVGDSSLRQAGADLERAHAKIAELEAERDGLEEAHRELSERARQEEAAWKERLQRAESAVAELQGELDDTRGHMRELTAKTESQARQLVTSGEVLQQLEAELEAANASNLAARENTGQTSQRELLYSSRDAEVMQDADTARDPDGKVKALQTDLVIAEQRGDHVLAELDASRAENSDLQEENRTVAEANANLASEAARLRLRLQELAEEGDDYRQQRDAEIDAVRTEVVAVEGVFNKVSDDYDNLLSESLRLRQRVAELEAGREGDGAKTTELRSLAQQLEADRDAAHLSLKESMASLHDARAQVAELLEGRAKAAGENAELAETCDTLRRQLQTLQDARDAAESKLRAQESEARDVDARLRLLATDYETERAKNDELERGRERAARDASELREQLQRMEAHAESELAKTEELMRSRNLADDAVEMQLRDQLANAESQLSQLRLEARATHVRADELERSKTRAAEERAELEAQLESTRAKLNAEDAKNGELEAQLESTRAKLNAEDAKNSELEAQLEFTRAKLNAEDAKNSELGTQLESTRARMDSEEAKNGELERSRDRAAKIEREAFETEVDTVKATNSDLQKAKAAAESVARELEEQLSGIRSELAASQAEGEALHLAVDRLTDEARELRQRNEEAGNESAGLRTEISNSERHLDDSKAELGRLGSEVDRLKLENDELRDHNTAVQKDTVELRKQIEASHSERERLADEADRLRDEAREVRQATEAAENVQKAQAAELRDQLESSKAELGKLGREVNRLTADNDGLRESNAAAQEDMAELRKQSEASRSERETLDGLKQGNDVLEAQLREKQADHASLQARLQDTETETEAQKARAKFLSSRNAELAGELEQLHDLLKAGSDESNDLKATLADQFSELAAARVAISQRETALADTLKARDGETEALSETRRDLSAAREEARDKDEKLAQISSTNATLLEETKALSQERASLEERVAEIQRELARASDTLHDEQDRASAFERANAELQRELNERLDDISNMKREQMAAEQSAGKASRELADSSDALNGTLAKVTDLESMNANLRHELDASLRDNSNLKHELAEASDALRNATAQITELEASNASLRQELDATQRDTHRERAESNAELQAVRAQVAELEAANSRLQEEAEASLQDKSELKHRLQQSTGDADRERAESNAELQAVRAQVAELEAANSRLQEEAEASLQDKSELKHRLQRSTGDADRERAQINAELQAARAQVAALEAANSRLQEEAGSSLQSNSELKRERAAAHASAVSFERELAESNDALRSCEARLAEAKKAKLGLQGDLDAKLEEMADLKREHAATQLAADVAKRDLAATSDVLRATEEKVRSLELRSVEMRAELDASAKQIADLKRESATAQLVADDTSRDVAGLNGTLQRKETRIGRLEQANAELRVELETYLDDIAGLKRKQAASQQTAAEAERELSNSGERLRAAEAKVGRLEAANAELFAELGEGSRRLAELERERAAALKSADESTSRNTALQHEMETKAASLRDDIQAMADEREADRRMIHTLQERSNASTDALRDSEERVESMTDAQARLQVELDEARKAAAAKDGIIDRLSNALAEARSEATDVNLALSVKEAEYQTALEHQRAVQRDLDASAGRDEKTEKTLAELSEHLSAAVAERDAAREQLHDAQQALQARDATVDALSAANAKLRQQAADAHSERDSDAAEKEAAARKQKHRVAQLEAEAAAARVELQTKLATIEDLRAAGAESSTKAERLSRRIASLERELASLEKQLTRSPTGGEAAKELAAVREQLQSTRRALEDKTDAVESARRSEARLRRKRDELEAVVADLQAKLRDRKPGDPPAPKAELNRENSELKAALSAAKASLAARDAEVAALRKAEAPADLQAELDTVEQSLAARSAEMDRLLIAQTRASSVNVNRQAELANDNDDLRDELRSARRSLRKTDELYKMNSNLHAELTSARSLLAQKTAEMEAGASQASRTHLRSQLSLKEDNEALRAELGSLKKMISQSGLQRAPLGSRAYSRDSVNAPSPANQRPDRVLAPESTSSTKMVQQLMDQSAKAQFALRRQEGFSSSRTLPSEGRHESMNQGFSTTMPARQDSRYAVSGPSDLGDHASSVYIQRVYTHGRDSPSRRSDENDSYRTPSPPPRIQRSPRGSGSR